MPEGYNRRVVACWVNRLFSDADGYDVIQNGGPVDASDRIFGENTDRMETFLVDAREVILIDHEYVNPKLNLAAGQDGVAQSSDNVTKLPNLQGVSVMEITEPRTAGRSSRTARSTA